jgi:hypothetical protein
MMTVATQATSTYKIQVAEGATTRRYLSVKQGGSDLQLATDASSGTVFDIEKINGKIKVGIGHSHRATKLCFLGTRILITVGAID